MVCAGLESCEVNKKKFPDPDNSFSVSVDFGDGEEKWTAASAEWVDFRSEYNEVAFHFVADGQFPLVKGSITPEGATLFPRSWEENEYLYFEYYSRNWEKIGDALWDYQYNIPYGDWQVDSGTVTITSLTSTHLSGTADLVMYSLVEYAIELKENPATKPLKVTFTDVPLQTGTRSGAIRAALKTSDGSFSFEKEKLPPRRVLAY
jgi:hypothetical protein